MRIFKFILLLMLFLFNSCGNNADINNKKLSDKVIIYDIKRKGCPACIYQERVFSEPDVKELLNRYCKVIYVDVNEQDKLPKRWMRSHKTPTVHFVDSNYNRLIPSINSVSAKEFKEAILRAKEALDKKRGV